MNVNFNNYTYLTSKSTDLLSCNCENCGNEFKIQKKYIAQEFKYNRGRIKFCSINCFNINKTKIKSINCSNCGKSFDIKNIELNKSKSNNHFCSRSCAAIYNNTHKVIGSRRSKLEKYLEDSLRSLYPTLDFIFNNKTAINSELDIYIPSLKLAFELNGIFHYEPIYGGDKLNKIKNNDDRKFQACLEQNIELCIIDTSQQKYFKEITSQIYLNIICDVINKH